MPPDSDDVGIIDVPVLVFGGLGNDLSAVARSVTRSRFI